MSLLDADTQDDSHAARNGTTAIHFQNLVLGHRVGSRVHHFPHMCPGPDCAIARWILAKDSREEYRKLKRRAWTSYREQE